MAGDSNIGIFGGIFDPVHSGHLAAAALALDYFGLDFVYLIPSGVPPHKHGTFAGSKHRLAMLQKSIDGVHGLKIWDGEIKRSGPSYSIDTLEQLRRSHPSSHFFFIIGSDNLKEIPAWKDYAHLLELVTLCVAHRPGNAMKRPKELEDADIRFFPGPEWKASSTLIRKYLKNGYSCRYLLPYGVPEYISKHRLYAD
jgi:nicotinate-nucleotide adenylyltransferase